MNSKIIKLIQELETNLKTQTRKEKDYIVSTNIEFYYDCLDYSVNNSIHCTLPIEKSIKILYENGYINYQTLTGIISLYIDLEITEILDYYCHWINDNIFKEKESDYELI